MEKRNLRNQRGITLIALVVTIIILLILAGVSFGILKGKNGIIVQANKASESTRIASIQEQIDLWKIKNEDEPQDINKFLDKLEKEKYITKEEKEKIIQDHELKIGDSDTIYFPFKDETVIEAFNKGTIKVGDYVTNYNDFLTGNDSILLNSEETGCNFTQIFKQDKQNTAWRVLGISPDGMHLMLISAENLKGSDSVPYLMLKGAEGVYSINEKSGENNILDRISRLYDSDIASEVRSVNLSDIENALGIKVDRNQEKIYRKDGSEITIGIFKGEYTYKRGDYVFENYLREKYPMNEAYKNLAPKKAGDKEKAFVYQLPIYISEIGLDMNSNPAIKLLLPGSENGAYNSRQSYWLTSKEIRAMQEKGMEYTSSAYYNGIVGDAVNIVMKMDGTINRNERGVRPIVYLKNNITTRKLNISSENPVGKSIWEGVAEPSYGIEKITSDIGKIK